MSEFEKYYKIVSKVPKGKVITYLDVARAAGTEGGARAVGNAMACNPYMPKVPCHRVVKSDGRVGGYRGNHKLSIEKARMLRAEGVDVDLTTGKIRNFAKYRAKI